MKRTSKLFQSGFIALALGCLAWAAACGGDDLDPNIVDKNISLKNSRSFEGMYVMESEDLNLDWHEGVLSSAVYAELLDSKGELDFIFVSEVKDPTGKTLTSIDGIEDLINPFAIGPPIRPMTLGASAHLLLPQSDQSGQARGRYTYRLAAFPEESGKTVRARIRTVSREAKEDGGSLSLNLFFPKGGGLASKDLKRLEPALKVMFDAFEEVGISRGKVKAYDIDAPEASSLSMEDMDSGSAIRSLVQRSSVAKNSKALNLFVVPQIKGPEGAVVLGLSMGLPGALAISGTLSSGVVVSLNGHESEDGLRMDLLGLTMAHEGGHFMGLFHSSEAQAGLGNDLISDTPECTASHDRNGNKILEPHECPDAENLMFWAGETGGSFSPGQGKVLRASAILQGAEEGAEHE